MREYYLFFSQRKEAYRRQASREYSPFFSQRREGVKKSLTTFASLRLCESIFLFSQRKKACSRVRASNLFFSRKEGKALREVSQPLRLCACLPQVGLCESIFLFSQRKKAFRRLRASNLFFSRKEGKACLRKAGAKGSITTFAASLLCESIFFRLLARIFNIYNTPA